MYLLAMPISNTVQNLYNIHGVTDICNYIFAKADFIFVLALSIK